jgi:ABC-type tungstate transport system permease subunit
MSTAELNRCSIRSSTPRQGKRLPGALADWLTSADGQAAIGAYTLDGEQLFHPSADASK